MSEIYRAKPSWLLYEVTSTLENGVETYTRQMDFTFFKDRLPMEARRGPDAVKKMAAQHLYVFHDRPHWSQIMSVEADVITSKVTIRIQRGHYFIAHFIIEHLGHDIITDLQGNEILLQCFDCGKKEWIRDTSVPSKLPPKID